VDVTKRTTIQAGLDPSNFEAGAQKIAATMTQSAQAIQRALLGSSAAFDSMKAKLIEGQKEAMAFATAYMTIMRAVADGRDKLGQSASMIDTLVKQFNLVGPAANAAKQAVMGMADATANTASRLKATQDLLTVFQERDPGGGGSGGGAVGSLNRSLSQLTNSSGQSQFAMRQLGVQAIQTFQGFATGQPIMMTLIQQGHQVADVMIASGTSFKELGESVVGFLRLIPGWAIFLGILGGIASVLALIAVNAEKAERQTLQLQNSVNAARPGQGESGAAQAEQAARQLAATTELGRQEALTAASVIVTNRAWQGNVEQLKAVIVVAENMRRSLGSDLQTEIKKLSDAMQDPGKAADEASKRFGVFTSDVVKHIHDLQQSGDLPGAFKLFFQTMDVGTKNAQNNLTALEKAWRDFNELATGDSTKSAWRSLGETINGVLAAILNKINEDIEQLRELTHPTAMWQAEQMKASGAQETVVSTAGALGIMQLMPGTAKDMGVNPYIPEENVQGGLKYIQKLAQQFEHFPGGVEAGVARAYNVGPGRNLMGGAATSYLEKVQGANIGNLPTDVSGMIEFWGQKLGLPPNLIELGKRIAVVEHGWEGKMVVQPPAAAAAATVASAGGGVGDPDLLRRQQEASKSALEARQAENARQQLAQQQAIDQQTARLQQAEMTADPEAIKRETQALTELQRHMIDLRSEQNRLLTDQQKLAQSATDATRPLTAQAGAARTLAEVENQFRTAARDTNAGIVEQAALSEALRAKQVQMTQQRHDEITALDDQTRAQNAQNTMIEIGGQAAEHAANFEKAVIEAKKTAVPGTHEYAVAVTELTEAYDRNTQAKRDNLAASDIHQANQQLEFLQKEAELVNASTTAREKELAILRERQKFGLAPGAVADAEQQRAIDKQGDVAQKKVENDDLKASYNELANSVSQSFDTIGSSMADAFLQGKDAAVSFQSVMKTVVQQIIQEVIKLSIINPILNSLFPGSGTRPTMSSVADALSQGGGGGIFSAIKNSSGFLGTLFGGTGLGPGLQTAGDAAALLGLARGGVVPSFAGLAGLPGIGNFSNMIVNQPTLFRAYAQGGVMGEAGPEAVMPLVRGPNGALGVRGSGGGTAVVINTPITIQGNATGAGGKLDPQALAALQKQIEGAVKDAARRTIVDEKRPGGDLFGG